VPADVPGGDHGQSDILRRKSEHVDIVLAGDVAARATTTGLERIRFEHVALPEIDLDQIDLSTEFLGRRIAAPVIISSMTGGPLHARAINEAIAITAGRLGIAFAVGSQRVALEGRGDAGFGRELRRLAGAVPILANIGAAQLAQWDPMKTATAAIEMIDADALIVHLNPLQEAVQAGGDRNWAGLLNRIEALARDCPCPLVIKEVGSGISAALSRRLFDAGVQVIDVAGAGGTSWAAVEGRRAASPRQRTIAEAFRDWGIPTATAIAAVRAACPAATVIASGGIRDGVDAAKALRLGADLVGQAASALQAALDGPDALTDHFSALIEQLRIVCFCTGSADLAALRSAALVEQPID
jgi:isopentenyl-diphosphate delta-isomerase